MIYFLFHFFPFSFSPFFFFSLSSTLCPLTCSFSFPFCSFYFPYCTFPVLSLLLFSFSFLYASFLYAPSYMLLSFTFILVKFYTPLRSSFTHFYVPFLSNRPLHSISLHSFPLQCFPFFPVMFSLPFQTDIISLTTLICRASE